jgi:hypothetical protein
MTVQTIHTPTDFRATVSACEFTVHTVVGLPPEVEPEIRRRVDAIFEDLPYIDAGDYALTSSYLESIEQPLAELRAVGLQLVAVSSTGTMSWPAHGPDELAQAMPWSRTTYLVASDPSYFHLQGEDEVHVLGAQCPAARRLVAGDARAAFWPAVRLVDAHFEGSVPWCTTCLLDRPPAR